VLINQWSNKPAIVRVHSKLTGDLQSNDLQTLAIIEIEFNDHNRHKYAASFLSGQLLFG